MTSFSLYPLHTTPFLTSFMLFLPLRPSQAYPLMTQSQRPLIFSCFMTSLPKYSLTSPLPGLSTSHAWLFTWLHFTNPFKRSTIWNSYALVAWMQSRCPIYQNCDFSSESSTHFFNSLKVHLKFIWGPLHPRSSIQYYIDSNWFYLETNWIGVLGSSFIQLLQGSTDCPISSALWLLRTPYLGLAWFDQLWPCSPISSALSTFTLLAKVARSLFTTVAKGVGASFFHFSPSCPLRAIPYSTLAWTPCIALPIAQRQVLLTSIPC